jgi:predicted homoserine dehydrogenase-like protein
MRLVAISNRTLPAAEKAYRMAGIEEVQVVASKQQLEQMIANGQPAITSDAKILCEAEGIDVIVEVTGTIEFAARLVIDAISQWQTCCRDEC